MPLVWLDGVLRERGDATVSVDDLGFLYGAACFETMRAFGGVVFRVQRHLDRLEAGLRAMGVQPPERDALADAVAATLDANRLPDARIRLTVSAGRGVGRPDVSSAAAPTVLVVAEPPPPDPAPVHLIVVSQQVDPTRALPTAKTANYLASLLALAAARAAGGDEALLLGPRGDAVEAATANLFAVVEGRLLTPPLSAGPLPGVTREAVLECARALGLPAAERRLPRALLADAAEVFVTNSIAGVRAVSSIDGWWTAGAPEVPGPHTYALSTAYRDLVARECMTHS